MVVRLKLNVFSFVVDFQGAELMTCPETANDGTFPPEGRQMSARSKPALFAEKWNLKAYAQSIMKARDDSMEVMQVGIRNHPVLETKSFSLSTRDDW